MTDNRPDFNFAHRRQPYDALARFRVSERLLAAAEAKAVDEGVSLSEFFRRAIHNEVRA